MLALTITFTLSTAIPILAGENSFESDPKITLEEYEGAPAINYRAAMLNNINLDSIFQFVGTVIQTIPAEMSALIISADKPIGLKFFERPQMLNNDTVFVWGRYKGTITYRTAQGLDNTVPLIQVDYYMVKEQNGQVAYVSDESSFSQMMARLAKKDMQRKIAEKENRAKEIAEEQKRKSAEEQKELLGIKTKLSMYPIEMVKIPKGQFIMGSPDSERDRYGPHRPEEGPLHDVTISKSFLLGKYEITRDQWFAVMGSPYNSNENGKLPIIGITWFEAISFCNKLSNVEGLKPVYSVNGRSDIHNLKMHVSTPVICDWEANGYRLPTEAEWEYAARAGSSSRYYWGNQLDKRYIFVAEGVDLALGYHSAPFSENFQKGKYLQPVGQYLPNGFGLHDVSGNASEWCWDYLVDDYYAQSPKLDPKGPDAPRSDDYVRVRRGGDPYFSVRSAARDWGRPVSKDGFSGLRVAKNNY